MEIHISQRGGIHDSPASGRSMKTDEPGRLFVWFLSLQKNGGILCQNQVSPFLPKALQFIIHL
jgi:hypothetical protein